MACGYYLGVMKKRILLLTFTLVERDPRALKQIEALKDKYDLTVMGRGDFTAEGVRFIPISRAAPRPA